MDDDAEYQAVIEKKMAAVTETMGKRSDGNSKIDQKHNKQMKRELRDAVGPLLESSRKAFTAYICGYLAKEKAVRNIFSTRALHLGHVARSFALKEIPTTLAKANSNQRKENKDVMEEEEDADILKSTGKKRSSRLAFGSKGKKLRGDEAEEADNSKGIKDYLLHPFGLGWKYLWNILLYK